MQNQKILTTHLLSRYSEGEGISNDRPFSGHRFSTTVQKYMVVFMRLNVGLNSAGKFIDAPTTPTTNAAA